MERFPLTRRIVTPLILNALLLLIAQLAGTASQKDEYQFAYIGWHYGVIDENGAFVVPAKFRLLQPFSDGLAAAITDDTFTPKKDRPGFFWDGSQKCGFINRSGTFVIPQKFSGVAMSFYRGRAVVEQKGRRRLIDTKGTFLPGPSFGNSGGEWSEGMLAVAEGLHKWGFIDTSGELIVKPQYDGVSEFHNGMATVYANGKLNYNKPLVLGSIRGVGCGTPSIEGSRAGLIDRSGKILLPPRYDDIRPLSKDAVFYLENGKWSTMTPAGVVILRNAFDSVETVGNEELQQALQGHWENWIPPSESVATARQGAKFVYVSASGQIMFNKQFDDALPFSEALAPVGKRNLSNTIQYGFIDKTGKEVIPSRFELARCFRDGFAAVKLSGKWGFIDKHAHMTYKPAYDLVSDFHEGYAMYKVGSQIGIMRIDGSSYSLPGVNNVLPFSEHLAVAQSSVLDFYAGGKVFS